MPKKILFVCTGNTCRSSMAEYLFRHFAEQAGRSNEFEVRSAGVFAMENDPASLQAIEVLGKRGITAIENHQATTINEQLVKEADLILTMTQNHKKRLLELYPEVEQKVFTLKEYTSLPVERDNPGFSPDISDPFGQPVEIYEKCAGEIENYIKRLLEKI